MILELNRFWFVVVNILTLQPVGTIKSTEGWVPACAASCNAMGAKTRWMATGVARRKRNVRPLWENARRNQIIHLDQVHIVQQIYEEHPFWFKDFHPIQFIWSNLPTLQKVGDHQQSEDVCLELFSASIDLRDLRHSLGTPTIDLVILLMEFLQPSVKVWFNRIKEPKAAHCDILRLG